MDEHPGSPAAAGFSLRVDGGHAAHPGVVTRPARQHLLLDQGVDLRPRTLAPHHHRVVSQEHQAVRPRLWIEIIKQTK